MNDVAKRIESLSPERRKLLERLLSSRGGRRSDSTEPPRMEWLSTLTGEKGKTKRFYDAVNRQLDPTEFGRFAYFLNYGYVSDGGPEDSVVQLPPHFLNRNSVKLALEVVGDCPLRGATVLDVGCGRGGTVHVMRTFFQPARIVGLDLSSAAVRFCTRTHRHPETAFVEGDSERLPFASAFFDAVSNIESSHLYPDRGAFYREVWRTLRPGGRFLYADLLPARVVGPSLDDLRRLGFSLERERDITRNVLLSCDEIARNRVGAYQDPAQADLLEEFLAAPGSQVYREIESGVFRYIIVTARKPKEAS